MIYGIGSLLNENQQLIPSIEIPSIDEISWKRKRQKNGEGTGAVDFSLA